MDISRKVCVFYVHRCSLYLVSRVYRIEFIVFYTLWINFIVAISLVFCFVLFLRLLGGKTNYKAIRVALMEIARYFFIIGSIVHVTST